MTREAKTALLIASMLGYLRHDAEGRAWLTVEVRPDGSTREVPIPAGETALGYGRTWGLT